MPGKTERGMSELHRSPAVSIIVIAAAIGYPTTLVPWAHRTTAATSSGTTR